MIDEKLFTTEIRIPEEFESMFSVTLNHSKLKDIMKFIMKMLQRHEKGIKLALDKLNPISTEVSSLSEVMSKIDSNLKSNESKVNEALESCLAFEDELRKKVDSSDSLKYALELTTTHDSLISQQKKQLDDFIISNEKQAKTLSEVSKTVKNMKKTIENFQLSKQESTRRISRISERVLENDQIIKTHEYEFDSGENEFLTADPFEKPEKSENNEKVNENIALVGKAVESGFNLSVVGHKIDEKTAGFEGLKKLELKMQKSSERLDKIIEKPQNDGERFLRIDERRNKTEEKFIKKAFNPSIYEGVFPFPNKIYSENEKFSSPTASNASEIKISQKSNVYLPGRIKSIESRLDIVERILAESEPAVLFNKLEHIEKTFRFYESVIDKLEPEIMKNRLNIKKLTEKQLKIEKELIHKTSVDQFDPIRNLVLTLASGSSRRNLISIPSSQDSNYAENFNSRLTELENFYLSSKISSINFEEMSYQLNRIEQKLDFKSDSTELDLIKQTIHEVAEHVKLFRESGERPVWQKSDQGQFSSLNRKMLQLEAQFKLLGLPPGLSFQSISEEIRKIWDSIKLLLSSFDSYSETFNSKFNELALTGFAPNIEKIKKNVEIDLKEILNKLSENNEKKFADKFEMLRGFKYVEGYLNRLEKIIRKTDAEEVILAKKPLNGWTCVSCEKVVEKLSGNGGGYTAWNKLPNRDPKDRIMKAGSGYSNMILKLEPLTKKKGDEPALTERSLTPTPLI